MNIHIQNALVLQDFAGSPPARQDIYISEGTIAGVGQAPAGFAASSVIDGARKLAMPGLVNCHTHTYMTLFRNYADDLPFHTWLFERIMPREDSMTPEDAYWCSLLACVEMLRTGTTCFLDMHMFRGQSMRAAAETGLRSVMSRGLVGENPKDPGARERLEDALAETETARQSDGMAGCMLAPHAIYTCGDELLRHIAALGKQQGLRLHIHLAETKKEFDDCMAQHGCTPTQHLEQLGLLDLPTVAAHCVQLTDEDIQILKKHNVYVATCPISNMKLGNGFAPVPRLLNAGVGLCVGTDGAASNNNLNLFKELAALCLVHKGHTQDPTAVTAPQALHAATAGGAAALGLAGRIGKIQPGMRADLILLDLDNPGLQPENDPAAALVYATAGTEVDTAIVDGRILMEKGQVLTVDCERLYHRVEGIRARLLG